MEPQDKLWTVYGDTCQSIVLAHTGMEAIKKATKDTPGVEFTRAEPHPGFKVTVVQDDGVEVTEM